MATTNIIQTIYNIKQFSLNNRNSFLGKLEEEKQIVIQTKNISKQEEEEKEVVIEKKKYCLNESKSMKESRLHSLSHWLHFTPSLESMASAGWFSCNINDRVICIYCNTICHQWTINDDPIEVHKRLSPQCPFVLSISSIEHLPKIINENFNEKFEPFHRKMTLLSSREATFSNINWPENCPTIDNLVRAGFFYSGNKNIVTCFYCNGSLHKWGSNDNPMIEHARWFPSCTYAKHLCGNKLYDKIQMTKKRMIKENKIDKDELDRLVAARLDLPVVEHLRSKYDLSIIKRCIKDQLRIKNDDFISDIDLTMSCLILQKQVDIIKGSHDKIIIPSKNQETKILSEISKESLGDCLICLSEEKQLACIPCGHLCTCVPCGYALHSCPICRQNIQSFVRINS